MARPTRTSEREINDIGGTYSGTKNSASFMSENSISLSEIITFLSPSGQQQLVDFVRQAREQRGSNWLPEMQAEFPMLTWVVDLVCNHTADEAFTELQRQFPNYPLQLARPSIYTLHDRLRLELEKKRF